MGRKEAFFRYFFYIKYKIFSRSFSFFFFFIYQNWVIRVPKGASDQKKYNGNYKLRPNMIQCQGLENPASNIKKGKRGWLLDKQLMCTTIISQAYPPFDQNWQQESAPIRGSFTPRFCFHFPQDSFQMLQNLPMDPLSERLGFESWLCHLPSVTWARTFSLLFLHP